MHRQTEPRHVGSKMYQRRSFSFQQERREAALLDKELQEKLHHFSQELLVQFQTLLRMLNFHSRENEATQKVLLKLHDAIKQLFETEYELHVEFTGSDFIINDRWIRLPRQLQDLTSKLGGELKNRQIGGFWISKVPSIQEIQSFIRLFVSLDYTIEPNPFTKLQNQLWSYHIEWMTLEKYVESFNWEGDDLDLYSYIRQIYFVGIQSVQQAYLQANEGKSIKIKAAKRSIQAFVELFTSPRRKEEADFLVLLTNVKDCLSHRYTRAVNTAVLSIGFAHHLGFPRNALRDVGIAALLYDIGLTKLPPYLEYKQDKTPEEQKAYEAHPALAVPIILNTTFVDSSIMRATNVAFAHHLGLKSTGFPSYGHSVQSPLSQVIAMIEQYNLFTTPHPRNPKIMSLPQALGELTLLTHPILIRKFISYMGTMPIGTLVQLENQDIGYVVKTPEPQQDPLRPVIKIILSPHGNKGKITDLRQTYANGTHPWNLAKILDLGHRMAQQALLKDLLI